MLLSSFVAEVPTVNTDGVDADSQPKLQVKSDLMGEQTILCGMLQTGLESRIARAIELHDLLRCHPVLRKDGGQWNRSSVCGSAA